MTAVIFMTAVVSLESVAAPLRAGAIIKAVANEAKHYTLWRRAVVLEL